MQRALPYLIGLCVALWLGGLVALFMFVSTLFRADHGVAVNVAPFMFYIFERYQLMLASTAIASAIVWRVYRRTRPRQMLLACLLVAALLGLAQYGLVSPRMNALHASGESPEQFRRLHGYSMLIYVGTALMVLLSGAALLTDLVPWRGRIVTAREV
jgi:hypothetical protein